MTPLTKHINKQTISIQVSSNMSVNKVKKKKMETSGILFSKLCFVLKYGRIITINKRKWRNEWNEHRKKKRKENQNRKLSDNSVTS